jgi:hypothetical protein
MQTFSWPNFFVVGAAKCGTTSLYAELKKHPQVFLPVVKEPHFFSSTPPPPTVSDEHCTGDLVAYQHIYEGAEQFPAIGDASPSYLWDEAAAARIHQVSPQAKIVIILRDAVARAHSAYLMNRTRGSESTSRSFFEAVKEDQRREEKGWWTARLYVELGLYAPQVRRFIEMFGREQVLVLLFDDLNKRPQQLYSQVAQHVGIDPAFFELQNETNAHNVYRGPRSLALYRFAARGPIKTIRQKLLPAGMQKWLRHSPLLYGSQKPVIDEESSLYLQKIFEPDVAELEALLERKLPELRKSWVMKATD